MPERRPRPRGPTTATLRAIEAVLSSASAPMTRYQIRRALPTLIAAPLLDEALVYLAEHNLIVDEGPGGTVAWIGPPGRSRRRRSGTVPPSSQGPPLARLIRSRRREILSLAAKHGVEEVRLFGSVARGEEGKHSDIDFLIRLEPGRSLLDHIAFQQDVQELLGVKVDVVSEGGVSPYIRDAVFREAVPV